MSFSKQVELLLEKPEMRERRNVSFESMNTYDYHGYDFETWNACNIKKLPGPGCPHLFR